MINVGVTAHNIDNLGIKAILKTAGKQTAKAMVKRPDGQPAETKEEEVQKQEVQKKEEEEKKK